MAVMLTTILMSYPLRMNPVDLLYILTNPQVEGKHLLTKALGSVKNQFLLIRLPDCLTAKSSTLPFSGW